MWRGFKPSLKATTSTEKFRSELLHKTGRTPSQVRARKNVSFEPISVVDNSEKQNCYISNAHWARIQQVSEKV